MKNGAPFGIAGIWENWKEPASGGVDQNVCDHYDQRQ
jgi:hypothetical protein